MADGSNRLAEIIAYKREEVATLRRARTLASLEADAAEASPPRGFASALLGVARSDGNALICEVKRRSPSAGEINTTRSPTEAARAYETGGAACISVLTDGPSFGGSLADLRDVRAAVALPTLRKDFMVDPIQAAESRAAGADAILIILAALSDAQAQEIHQAATVLGMSVLLEAHNESELQRALDIPSPLVGVNNRDLRAFTTDLAVTERLAGMVPKDKLLISESGLKAPADAGRLRACGARGFLIGETVMRASDPAAAVRAFVEAR